MEAESSKSQNMRDFRLLRAVKFFKRSMKQVDIARVLGVTKGVVSQWLSMFQLFSLDKATRATLALKSKLYFFFVIFALPG